MDLRPISDNQKAQYNNLVTHVIQSWEWGEFRKKMGLTVLRYGIYRNGKLSAAFQLTLHKIPLTKKCVGYLPKGPYPDKDLADALTKIAKEQNCAFIKVEPNVIARNEMTKPASPVFDEATRSERGEQSSPEVDLSKITCLPARQAAIKLIARNDRLVVKNFHPSLRPLFTKYNFVLDLTKSEEELLKNMHSKTRYNIKVAQKHRVQVKETTDYKDLETYLKLYFETTKRQGYHGHNEQYHQKVWETLKDAGMARLLIATYKNTPITAWMLFKFKNTLYYPYGGSTQEHKEVMSNNLIAWEAIRLGRRLKLKYFDMWGALGPNADPKDPWFGFHKFKQGYGGRLVEYIGTYDFILDWPVYWLFTAIDKLTPVKVLLLKLLRQ